MLELTLRPPFLPSQLVCLSALAGSDLIQAGCMEGGVVGGKTLLLVDSA